jgi:hypothetical protein
MNHRTAELRKAVVSAMHERWCGTPPSCGEPAHRPCDACSIDREEVNAVVNAAKAHYARLALGRGEAE